MEWNKSSNSIEDLWVAPLFDALFSRRPSIRRKLCANARNVRRARSAPGGQPCDVSRGLARSDPSGVVRAKRSLGTRLAAERTPHMSSSPRYVRDLMTSDARAEIGCLVVVERSRIVGILTEADFVRFAANVALR
jgi:CBS domain-containing protein